MSKLTLMVLFLLVGTSLSRRIIGTTPINFANPVQERTDVEEDEPVCHGFNGASDLQLEAAGNGYNLWKSNPLVSTGDPGAENNGIFEVHCTALTPVAPNLIDATDGFWSSITAISDLNCVKEFSSEKMSNFDDYMEAHSGKSAMDVRASVSAAGGVGGVSFSASASARVAGSKEFASAKKFFEETNGEVYMENSLCNTFEVLISRTRRPKFTKRFIDGLLLLNNAIKQNSESKKQDAYNEFVSDFGTHFSRHTIFGAKLTYERRFHSRSVSSAEEEDRKACSVMEAKVSVGGGYGGVSASASASYAKSSCSQSSNSGSKGSEEVSASGRLISIGSRPVEGEEWAGSVFKPVPVDRSIELISNLFKPEWLEQSEVYGIPETLQAEDLKSFFKGESAKYCQNVMGKTDEECENTISGCGINDDCALDQICKSDATATKGFRCISTTEYTFTTEQVCNGAVWENRDITCDVSTNCIRVPAGGKCIIKNSRITGIGTGRFAHLLRDAQLTMDHVSVSKFNAMMDNNGRPLHGAVVNIDTRGYVNMTNCKLYENMAKGRGGVIYMVQGSINITDSTMQRNYARDGGGAISTGINQAGPHANINIMNTVFDENSVLIFGGAIQMRYGGTASIRECTFSKNKAQQGGAIQAYSGPQLDIVSSEFNSNEATHIVGGAIQNTAAVMTIRRGSTFTQNLRGTGSNPTDNDIYCTKASGQGWGKIYTLLNTQPIIYNWRNLCTVN